MTITPGARLGPYEIVAPIGAGGMGEVYRARDTRLDRQVAIKVVREQFNLRFEREARTISQLSHPNICALFDVGENYLVMELLEGETLADRLTRGALPLADVLKYGVQIAEALGRAHRAGIVHRDLKPGNIMLTKSGAKLLDFGLAKGGAGGSEAPAATEQRPLTAEGTVLGTFQYMAPEQIAGEEADERTDIFAFGMVLYEMATGRPAFEGKTRTSLVAAIVGGQPRPLSELQPLTPRALEHVIQKCLAKDPDERWQSASDVAEELRWIGEEQPPRRAGPASRWPLIAAVAALAVVVGAVIGAWSAMRRRPIPPLTYSEISAPEGTAFVFDASTAVISPDGRWIVFVARSAAGDSALWIRPLDSPVARALRGTDNATFPFWSPDSKSIGFFADGKLKRMDIIAGTAETLADAGTPRGGSWSPDGTIVFTPTPASPLYAVPAAGGEVRQVTELNGERGDTSHRFPVFLPDGRHFLFFVQGPSDANILLGATDSMETRVITSAQAVAFAPPDYLLFVRDAILRAQHFDLKTFRPVGEAVPILDHPQVSGSLNFANFSVSNNGLLTYVAGGSATLSMLTFVDGKGKEMGTIAGPSEQLDVAVSNDGHAAAVSRYDATGTSDVWVYDLRRGIGTRQTFSPFNEFGPVWSPDNKTIVFTSFERRPGDLFTKRVDTSGPGELLYEDKRRKVATCWSSDGNYVIYHALTPASQWDIEAYSLRDRKVIPLVKTSAAEMHGQLSPDMRWLAYSSSESGRTEVFVRPFLGGSQHWQVSGDGGSMPKWSRDGHQLFFVSPRGEMMVAAVHNSDGFSADAPRPLFVARIRLLQGITRGQYDVTPDGRFLMNIGMPATEKQLPITLVQNWTTKLPR
jgi:Tol biopolymer transport system component/predicted Ser/Thr protein kinase